MSKLHELLAVEGDLEGIMIKSIDEGIYTFSKKIENFRKYERQYKPLVENEPDQPTEHHPMAQIVKEKLDNILETWVKFINVNIKKEYTNQTAIADLVIDGTILIKDVPATALLSLENKLKKLKTVFESLPTLQSNDWDVDDNLSSDTYRIYKLKYPEEKNRTVKSFAHKVLVPPTEHHPAQIEKWEENIVVGRYTKYTWSSELPLSQKNRYLSRIEKLIREVKMARQRANEIKVVDVNLGNIILKYILEK